MQNSKAHQIETKLALRGKGSHKLSCVVFSLSLLFYCLLLTVCVLCLPKICHLIVVVSSEVSQFIGHNLYKMQYLTVAFM
jgi:hypothetical protein